MKTITVSPIGDLLEDSKISGYWISKDKIPVPYFNNLPVQFVILAEEEELGEDFQKALENFFLLDKSQRLEASTGVYKNYKDYMDAVDSGAPSLQITNERDVWAHVHPVEIVLQKRQKDGSVYVQLNNDCDWETEHGLQLVYKEGNVLVRISPQDGWLTTSDAYGSSHKEDTVC